MASIQYYLGGTPDYKGNREIFMRVYIRRQYSMRIRSSIWIDPRRWGKKKGITIADLTQRSK